MFFLLSFSLSSNNLIDLSLSKILASFLLVFFSSWFVIDIIHKITSVEEKWPQGHRRFEKAWESLCFNDSGGKRRVLRLWFHTSINPAQSINPGSSHPHLYQHWDGSQIRQTPLLLTSQKETRQNWGFVGQVISACFPTNTEIFPRTQSKVIKKKGRVLHSAVI